MNELLLGLLQGVTEFLPVSSSGHLVVAQALLGVERPGASLEVYLHLGTIFAVGAYFWRLFRERRTFTTLMPLAILGTIPAAAAALLGLGWLDSLFNSPVAVGGFFLVNSGILLLAFLGNRSSGRRLNWWVVLAIGAAQIVALLPGISRSGTTIVAALLLGVEREEAFTFSFVLLVPAVLGGVAFEAKDIIGFGFDPAALLGFGAAFISGIAALVLLKRLVVSGKLWLFAPWTLVTGALTLLFSLAYTTAP